MPKSNASKKVFPETLTAQFANIPIENIFKPLRIVMIPQDNYFVLLKTANISYCNN